jgi:hypothetical protein
MCRLQTQIAVASLALTTLSTAAQGRTFNLLTPEEVVAPQSIVVTYDPTDGNLSYDGNVLISSLELISSGELFDPSKVNEGVILGPFDVFTSAKFFKLNISGNESVDVGPVLPNRLTAEVLVTDMQVDGSPIPAGVVSEFYLHVVPEPSCNGLIGLGLLGVLFLCHNQGNRIATKSDAISNDLTCNNCC